MYTYMQQYNNMEKKKIFTSLGENIRDVAKIFSHGIEQMLLLNMAADWHKIKEL